ncbi:hypothetical protein V6W75_01170 [Mannheimia sp. HC-2023]|uniref:hypothetical protein n=1 Tax=Mannheimia indoligenes TaxID=3103145 RepID=UPI002FE69006
MQEFLENFAKIANELRYRNEQPEYELSIDKIAYDDSKSFEENLKVYFIKLSENYLDYLKTKQTEFNKSHYANWKFKMDSSNDYLSAIYRFFNFTNLPKTEFDYWLNDFITRFENAYGKIQKVLSGYIVPPYQFNIYCQHWQHLYIKTEQCHILITFEANT